MIDWYGTDANSWDQNLTLLKQTRPQLLLLPPGRPYVIDSDSRVWTPNAVSTAGSPEKFLYKYLKIEKKKHDRSEILINL